MGRSKNLERPSLPIERGNGYTPSTPPTIPVLAYLGFVFLSNQNMNVGLQSSHSRQLRAVVTVITIMIIVGASYVFFLANKSKNAVTSNVNEVVVKTYRSDTLGITFRYAPGDLGKRTIVEEKGNTVYVYPEGTRREDGQFVRVFAKDRNTTLQQAVQQNFLRGYDQADCFVKNGTDISGTKPETGIATVIAYPISDATDDQWLMNAEKCPPDYSLTNGLRYFWTDQESSTRFVFFSTGQYIIPGNSSNVSWHETLQFITSG